MNVQWVHFPLHPDTPAEGRSLEDLFRGRNYDIYLVNLDGTGLEPVSTHGDFDGFPMFSPDGLHLVFASNRNGSVPGETNIFIADWVERP